VSNTAELEAAKENLAETLSTARDVTKTAVVEEIAPAVVAVVGAAREASGPLQAEAATRAGDAIAALRGSDAMAAVNDTLASIGENVADRLNASGSDAAHHRRRWPIVVTVVGAGAATYAVIRTRSHRTHSGSGSYTTPTPMPTSANAEAQPTVIPDEDEYE
jgi:hypothetical protein